MAIAGNGRNKSAFLSDLLQKSPGINEQGAVEAWKKAGNEGTISSSLYYTTKATLKRKAAGGTGDAAGPAGAAPRKSGPKAPAPKAVGKTAAPDREWKAKTDDRERMLTDVEGDIDRIIFKLMVLGGMERIEDELRSVRRTVTRSHGA